MELSIENLAKLYEFLKDINQKVAVAIMIVEVDDLITTPTTKTRSSLDSILNSLSEYVFNIAHVEVFLRDCEYLSSDVMTIKQQKTLLSCQQLYQQIKAKIVKIFEWSVKLKERLNQEGCVITDELENFISVTKTSDTNINKEDLLKLYDQTRSVLKEIHVELLLVDPDNMINTAGYALEVKEGNTLFIETAHEMDTVIDYGLFEYRKNGKNIAERYFDKNHTLYGPKKLEILTALKNTKFSLLEILEPINECGVKARDRLVNQVLFLIDLDLHSSISKTKNQYYLLTHYINMPLFALTTGAATPIIKNSSIGAAMGNIFEKIVQLEKTQSAYNRLERQYKYITDLYKMAIHEGLTQAVISQKLPMSFR